MRAKRTGSRSMAAVFLAIAGAAGAASCSGERGQLMVVFQTDMSLPKDIDTIRVEATLEGSIVYDETFERLGSEESIRLPATLGFLTPDDPSQALRVRVIASRGGKEGVRVLREVLTTVPEGRTATLHMPIQFLCDGSADVERDEQGNVRRDAQGNVLVKNSCPEGQSCVAGECKPREIDSRALPEFEARAVFGGGGESDGLCFDTVRCFASATSAQVDLARYEANPDDCVATAPSGEVNVALLTQGGGICGESACYVPLDAESDAGFRVEEGNVLRLPPAVCKRAKEGKLAGLAIAIAGEDAGEDAGQSAGTCRTKGTDLPTCGPWSALAGGQYTGPDAAAPIPVAVAQVHPVSLRVTAGGVAWISGTTFDEAGMARDDGELKTAPQGGGEPLVLGAAQASPRDLVVDEARQVVFWTNAADGTLRVAPLAGGEARVLLADLKQPEGLSLSGDALAWTELWGGGVFRATLSGEGAEVALGTPEDLAQPGSAYASPYRVASAGDVVCWTYQGTLGRPDGAVACRVRGETLTVAAEQLTPRELALDVDAQGNAAAVYWASFEGGSVFRADLSGEAVGEPEEVASDQGQLNGIAVDAEHVYWTRRDEGTVVRMPKDGGEPEALASQQARPGDVAVDETTVYWINEGSPDLEDGTPVKDGAVLKLAK
ncbi:hypothetical protein [Sorangium cellulosum]|uniref:DUF5050 domain-containing protein n=1 Tax=Sorangium cellulosum So0157-2 TaxID=1254432 RepID=S4XUB6_SORCE|nr:hypothetical protein [Sorangium cellulosum]AGP36119.1 hypothetical protein SCE1572_17390 [Sorangium cellulosum So0157-2]